MYSRSYGSSDGGKKRTAGQETPASRREKPRKEAPAFASGQKSGASKAEKHSRKQPPPVRQQSGGGPLSRVGQLFAGMDSQDLLLIGLIFLLAMEGADDDILFILIALLFISS